MGISERRDLDAVRAGLTRWLGSWRPGSDLRVVALEAPPTGLSAETLFLEIEPGPDGEGTVAAPMSLVARLPPAGDGLFPAYDLGAQGRLQGRLAAAGVPAVAPLAFEADPQWIGCPFLLMPRVDGHSVRNDQPYLRRGWLAERPPEVQARAHDEFLVALARIHRLPPTAAGGDLPDAPGAAAARGGSGLAGLVERAAAYLEWAGGGEAPASLGRAVTWCREHLPARVPPPSVLWGDVQLGNAVFGADGALRAVLDFEMAHAGPAEVDVGWYLVLHAMTVDRCGCDLPGFPGRDATLDRYVTLLGRPLEDLRWYEAFAALRSGAILVRAARLLARLGVDDSWLTQGNPTLALVDTLTAG